ncbi:ArnT family glycosyltransferase [Sphingomonas sp. CJ20]
MQAAIAALPRWSILLFAAVAVRALTFGNPVVHVDEEFYFVTARMMLDGALPFVDVWDRKPIGLFLLYLPAAAFGVPAGIWVYQMMALASVVATAGMILKLARRAGWERGGMVAALLYIFMLNFGDGQGGQAPVFYNLLTAIAIYLAVPRAGDAGNETYRFRRGVAAMALIGIALQIKYSVLFEGLFLGLWLMWREHRLGATPIHVLRRGAVWAAVAAVPTLLALVAYVAMGHGDAWLYANFGSILERQSDPAAVLLRAFLKIALILGLLLIVAGLSRRVPVNHQAEHPVRALYFGWLIAAVVGLIVFGSWFNHYALPVMLPACVCCAGYLGGHRLGRTVVAPAMLAMSLFGGEYTAWSAQWHRGNAQQLEGLARAIGTGPGCMYVYSGNSILYSYTGRCRVSPWLFPSHLSRERENGALGVDQLAEINRIFDNRPAIVVMRPEYFGERMEAHRLAVKRLAEGGYSLRGEYPLGDLMIAVYAAPGVEARAAPDRRLASKPS